MILNLTISYFSNGLKQNHQPGMVMCWNTWMRRWGTPFFFLGGGWMVDLETVVGELVLRDVRRNFLRQTGIDIGQEWRRIEGNSEKKTESTRKELSRLMFSWCRKWCVFFLVFGVVGSYCGFVAGLAGCGGGEHGRWSVWELPEWHCGHCFWTHVAAKSNQARSPRQGAFWCLQLWRFFHSSPSLMTSPAWLLMTGSLRLCFAGFFPPVWFRNFLMAQGQK